MSEEFPGISKDTYLKSNKESQDGLTYDMLAKIHQGMVDLGERVTALENDFRAKKKRDTVLTATMGLVGGAMAFFIQTAAFKKIV